MHRRVFSLSLLAMLVAGTASANGRFPRAQRLVASAEKSDVLALYGTYGLVVTDDGGRSWRHVCEAATGQYTGEDPLLELMPGAHIVMRTEAALVKSASSWCNYDAILGTEAEHVQDITRDPTRPDVILALTGSFDVNTGFVSHFVVSGDAGVGWSSSKELPRVSISRGLSLDVAPSRPERVYVTGLDANGQGQLLVSDDGGGSFVGRAIAGTQSSAAPYLAFVSKSDPDVLFVRTDTYEEVDGIDTAGDTLLVSVDAGVTWQAVLKKRAKLLGVALSPDEQTLLAGYGDPVVEATFLEPEDLGIYRARLSDVLLRPLPAESPFDKIYDASVTCLRWTDTALYACTSQTERGFEVGKASSAEFTLATPEPFTSLLKLPEVAPLACAAGTDAYACYTDPDNGFPSVCAVLGASCDVKPPTTVPEPDGGAGGSGGAVSGSGGSSSATGGAAPSGGNVSSGGGGGGGGAAAGAPATGGSGGTPASSENSDSSCACRSARTGAPSGAGFLALVALSGAFLVRRRKSPTGPQGTGEVAPVPAAGCPASRASRYGIRVAKPTKLMKDQSKTS
jgi:MYXO-CTERM domain-containing protein